MFCPKCGGKLKENARFCNHCGAAVGTGPAGGKPGSIQPSGARQAGPSGVQRPGGAGSAGPAAGYRPAGASSSGGYQPGGPLQAGMVPGQPPKKKRGTGWIIALILLLILLLLGGGGYAAYQLGLFDTILSSSGGEDKSEDPDEDEEEDTEETGDSGEEEQEPEELEASTENDGEDDRREASAAYGNELPDLTQDGEDMGQNSYSDPTTAAAMETMPATMPATTAAAMETMPATMPATIAATVPATMAGAGGAYGQSMPMEDYILPDSSIRPLTSADLAGLTKDQLRIARNEIYARHGRKFDSEDLSDYFNSKSWYRGTIAPADFRDSMLSQVEKDNLQVIKKAEENLQ
ncbi:MAG: YARHG domain-containing protein [Lachnospiraceae bacterium]|nr:YARHG domain-containing protein [Lachnospiraceae bacterium]